MKLPIPPTASWPSLWSKVYYTVLPAWMRKWYCTAGKRSPWQRAPPIGRAPIWKDEQ